eukprot:5270090-Pyramimonas_sp.AAC.1
MLENATFTGDLIGGPGSFCPGLFPLKSSTKFKASMFANVLPFVGGVLAIFPLDECGKHQKKPVYIRLLYTDSNHCMMPIDNCDNPEEADQKYLHAELMSYLKAFTEFDKDIDNDTGP